MSDTCKRVVPWKRWTAAGASVLVVCAGLAFGKPEPRPVDVPVAVISQVVEPPAPPVITAPPAAPKKVVVKKKPRPTANGAPKKQ